MSVGARRYGGSVPATGPAPTADAAARGARPVEELSYEQAREELVAVVARLEAGGATLEESLTLWERGEALATRCQQWLDGARARLDAARGEPNPEAPTSPRAPTRPGDDLEDER